MFVAAVLLSICSCSGYALVFSYCSSGAGERQACLEDFVKSPSKEPSGRNRVTAVELVRFDRYRESSSAWVI